MYQKLLSGLLTFALMTTIQLASAQEPIQWLHSLPEAQAKAKAENRVLLVHFWSTTCPPCRKLESTVFPNPRFKQTIGNGFVPVKVNINDHKDVARRYRIQRIPTDVFLTAEGAEVFRTISPQDPEAYVGLLDRIHDHVQGLKQPQNDAIATIDRQRRAEQPDARREVSPQPVGQPRTFENRLVENRYKTEPTNRVVSDRNIANDGPATSRYSADRQRAVSNPYYAAGPNPDGRNPDGRNVVEGPNTRGTSAEFKAPYGEKIELNNPRSVEESIPVVNRPVGAAPIVTQNSSDNPQPSNTARTNAGQANAGRPNTAPAQQFAILGYCPVTLVENMEWRAGDRRWGAVHEGQIYLFQSEQNQLRFRANPQRYVPGFRGFDAVHFHRTGKLVPGKCQFGIVYGDEYYLFVDEVALNSFWQQPDTYIHTVRQALAQSRARR